MRINWLDCTLNLEGNYKLYTYTDKNGVKYLKVHFYGVNETEEILHSTDKELVYEVLHLIQSSSEQSLYMHDLVKQATNHIETAKRGDNNVCN